MALPDKEKLYKTLEELGEEEVRERLALGVFGASKVALVKLWLERTRESGVRNGRASITMESKVAFTWDEVEKEYQISKRAFGKKINFIKDDFRKQIVFRDIEQAHFLASNGFYKPAVILAGGVIEELLRLYLEARGLKSQNDSLNSYIRICQEKGILKSAVHKLADSFREFRNLVHLEREESRRHTISRPTAKSAVASIFTITNDFERE